MKLGKKLVLNNNGYFVRGLSYSDSPQAMVDSWGVGIYVAWPLDYYLDQESQALREEAFGRWFCSEERFLLVPE